MRVLIVVAVLLLAVSAASPNYKALFAKFKADFGRKYASADEEDLRYDTFVSNMLVAEALQIRNPHATFGPNEFSDLSTKEFAARYRNGKRHFAAIANASAPVAPSKNLVAGTEIDWRKKDAVTGVKNQGQCGSCWSFSTTGNIEGQHAIKNKKLVSLSEQELVSCDTIDSGCNGGLMDNAFEWLIKHQKGEIVTEASYKYVSGGGVAPRCDLKDKVVGAKITSYKNIAKNENDMAAFVYASGPLSIAVDATSWQTYTGGILTDCISSQIDHGVLIVGFDQSHSPPYWIVKNSWGASWGEAGYIRIKKGDDQCLITSYPCTSIAA